MRTGIIKKPHPIIHTGTVVACDSGHKIAEVVAQISLNGKFLPHKQLGKFVVPEPAPTDTFPMRCPDCGAPWMVSTPSKGVLIHFEQLGWWPMEPKDAEMLGPVFKRKWWQFWKPKYYRTEPHQ